MKVVGKGKHRKHRRIVTSPKKISDAQRTVTFSLEALEDPALEKIISELRSMLPKPFSVVTFCERFFTKFTVPNVPKVRRQAEQILKEIELKKKRNERTFDLENRLRLLLLSYFKSIKKSRLRNYFWAGVADNWGHSRYYDVHSIKRILSPLVGRKNLDLASGAQSYFPKRTTALDVSPDLLHLNPSKKKILFNLDSLVKRRKIPLRANTFDSVTIIFGLNYFRFPINVLVEAKRLIKPETGKIILINSANAGFEGIVKQSIPSNKVESWLRKLGLKIKTQTKTIGSFGVFAGVPSSISMEAEVYVVTATKVRKTK